MDLSPLAQRLLGLLDGTAPDAAHWPAVSQLTTALGRPGDGPVVDKTWQNMVAPARELAEFLLGDPCHGHFRVLVAAGMAGIDAPEVRARLAGRLGPIALAEADLVLGWDVETRALFLEAVRPPAIGDSRPAGLAEWLHGRPGYPAFARAALELAADRVAAIHTGEIPYQADKAFDDQERNTLGRAVRLALLRDEPWLPDLLDRLLRGIAVAPTSAKTLPSQSLLFEIGRALQDHPTPEAISSLRAARQITRHAGVPKQLDRMFKRIEPALAERLEVAFRLPDGRLRQAVGEHTAVISIDGETELSWWHGDKRLRSVPAAVKRDHPEEVRRLREQVKLVRHQQATLARALEAGYTAEVAPPYRRLEGRPLTDRLIWEFETEPGVWHAELGLTVPDVPVRLWHPARATAEQVRAWRDLVADKELRQPFKQAFREIYPLTPAEVETGDHSLRFAEHVVDYRRLRALFKERGWTSNYLGPWEGRGGDARRSFAGGRWRATFDHDYYDEGYATTGRVLFHRPAEGGWQQAPLSEVPALVFGEAMRDIDLFIGVCSITSDPRWAGNGPDDLRTYWHTGSFGPLPPSAEVRRDALARLLPRLTIADRCTLTDRFLVVRGDLRTYKIHLGSGNILMEPNDAYLCVVAGPDRHSRRFLPFEEDGRLALILSKAFLLSADTTITDPAITRQLHS
ncbi:DUF4132 domain-containing protein [Spongiactinospora sp. TRM90649]|uniref:DUF4132 domain-containing protein n=1 Tax=Spongiactinospora sp. TRM90649 TaxID=3031114 RepID=UPI0023F9BD5F|nr:DUF4132 domain-containing protein [Spongiactinospora sp. TRM90649]MDF5756736.1 DUF4132 domain-containing protein [Spongiactinospora sp. TRM90649]